MRASLPLRIDAGASMLNEICRFPQPPIRFYWKNSHTAAAVIGHKNETTRKINTQMAWAGPMRRPMVQVSQSACFWVNREGTDGAARLAGKLTNFADCIKITLPRMNSQEGGILRTWRRTDEFQRARGSIQTIDVNSPTIAASIGPNVNQDLFIILCGHDLCTPCFICRLNQNDRV